MGDLEYVVEMPAPRPCREMVRAAAASRGRVAVSGEGRRRCRAVAGSSSRRIAATGRRARRRLPPPTPPACGIQPVFRSFRRPDRVGGVAMRFNPQETTGSRVRLRYSVDLHYDVAGRPNSCSTCTRRRRRARRASTSSSTLTPRAAVVGRASIRSTGNRIAAFSARRRAASSCDYAALVEIAHRIVDPADVVAGGACRAAGGHAALSLSQPLLPGRPRPAARVGYLRPACRAAMRRCAPCATGFARNVCVQDRNVDAARRRWSTRCATAPASAATSRTR